MGVSLRQVAIKNFRSLFGSAPAKIELGDGVNTLLGPNNAGKSNVLKALALALHEDADFSKDRDVPATMLHARPSISLTFRVKPTESPERTLLKHAQRYEESVGVAPGETYASDQMIVLRVKYQQERRQEFLGARGRGDRRGDETLNDRALAQLRKCIRFVLVKSGEDLETFRRGRFNDVLRSVLSEQLRKELNDAESQRKTYISKLQKGLLSKLQDRLLEESKTLFPEITGIDLIPSVRPIDETIGGAGIVVHDGAETDLIEKGTGVRGGLLVSMLRYLADHSKRSLVFAVEEPESFLHPAAQHGVRRELETVARRDDVTLITTTHSPFLLPVEESGTVVSVSKNQSGATSLETVDGEKTRLIDAVSSIFAETLLPHLVHEADSVPEGTEAVLVVEGEMDITYLRTAAELAEKDGLLDGIHIVSCSGCTRMPVEVGWWHRARAYPIIALLDSDDDGKRAMDQIKRLNLHKRDAQVLQYGRWWKRGAGTAVPGFEAEDLLPQSFLERFEAEAGKEMIEEKTRFAAGGPSGFHFGFTKEAKESVWPKYFSQNATKKALGDFIFGLGDLRTKFEQMRRGRKAARAAASA